MKIIRKHGGDVWEIGRYFHTRVDKFLDFSSNINPYGPPEKAREVFLRGFRKLQYYPDPKYIRLKEGLSRFLGTEVASIFAGNGLSEVIDVVSRSLGFRRAIILNPTYSEYEISLARSGARITHLTLRERDNFVLCYERFYKILSSSKELAIFLCNPNNPTGTFYSRRFLKELIKKASINRHWLIVDEAFIDFTPYGRGESLIPLVNTYPRLIVLWSLTKIFAFPGLRLGVAVASRRIIQRLKDMSPPWSVNILAEEVALASLKDRDFLRDTRRKITSEKKYISGKLKRFATLKVYASEANFFLVRILEKNVNAGWLRERLISHRILIRDCSNFRSLDRSFFRISVKDRYKNRKLISALTNYLD